MHWSHEQRAQKSFQQKLDVVDVFQKRMQISLLVCSSEVNFFDHGNNVDDGRTEVLAVEVGSLLHGVGSVLELVCCGVCVSCILYF